MTQKGEILMIITSESGASYITTPRKGALILTDSGVSEVFDLIVVRPKGEPEPRIRKFTRCYWLSPVEIGKPIEIQRSDNRMMWSTDVVSIAIEGVSA